MPQNENHEAKKNRLLNPESVDSRKSDALQRLEKNVYNDNTNKRITNKLDKRSSKRLKTNKDAPPEPRLTTNCPLPANGTHYMMAEILKMIHEKGHIGKAY